MDRRISADTWTPKLTTCQKFVDDITGREKNDMTTGIMSWSTRKEERLLFAKGAQDFFESARTNAVEAGMVVNQSKTQILCVSAARNSNVRSFISVEGNTLISSDKMKIVGYTQGRRAGVAEHIRSIRTKFARRSWVLRNLKKANIPPQVLVAVYCSMLRPVLEYCAPAFNPLITDEQSEHLERLQRNCLKSILGFKDTYRQVLEKAGVERLDD